MAIRPKIVYGNFRIPQQLKPPQLTQKDRNKGMGKHSAFVNFTFTTHTYHFYHGHTISNKIRIADHVIANT